MRVTILIAGGFHTPGITELLRDRNISYVVVTPRLGEDSSSDLEISPRKKRTDLEKAIAGIVGALRPVTLLGEESFKTYSVIQLNGRTLILYSQFEPREIQDAFNELGEQWQAELADRPELSKVIKNVDFLPVVLTRGREAFALGVARRGKRSLPFVFRYDAVQKKVSEVIFGEKNCREFLSGSFDNAQDDGPVVCSKLPKLWGFLSDADRQNISVIFGQVQPEAKNTVLESLKELDQEEIMERQEPVPSSSYTVMPWVFLGGFFDGVSQFTHNAVDVVTEQVSSIVSHLPSGGLPLETTLLGKSEVAKQLASLSPHKYLQLASSPL
ncbi:hypothetical protein ES705_23447 [subsurface metagenome]